MIRHLPNMLLLLALVIMAFGQTNLTEASAASILLGSNDKSPTAASAADMALTPEPDDMANDKVEYA